jgi:hypothetical protein
MTAVLSGTNGLLQSYDYQTPTTGFSYTFAAGTQVLVMNPAGTLATGFITMPASPADGMTITFSSSQQITALTLNGNTGQTVIGAVTSMSPKSGVTYVYRLANTTWYPTVTVPFYSMVRLNTGNGQGSTNTAIHRFTTAVTNQGSDITYADSATLGGSFTVNTSGIYSVSFSGAGSVATYQGISLNATQLSTAINSLTNVSEVLSLAYSTGANNSCSSSWTGYLPASSIVRAQGSVSASLSTPAAQFTIVRVS